MADCLGILEIGRDEVSEVDRIADAEEDVSICQRARALDLVDLALQFAAGSRWRSPRPPLTEPHQIDRHRRQNMLQVRLGLPDVPAPPQTATADRLGMGALDTGPRGILSPELLGRLPTPR